jgi:hypothetical protein
MVNSYSVFKLATIHFVIGKTLVRCKMIKIFHAGSIKFSCKEASIRERCLDGIHITGIDVGKEDSNAANY